jgi:hypothetical protein
MRIHKVLALLLITLMPMASLAQNRPQAGGSGGGMGGGAAGPLQEVLRQLDLTREQKTQIRQVMRQAMEDARTSAQNAASPLERMQIAQKMMTETTDKVAAELTPAQKTRFYPLMAKSQLTRSVQMAQNMQSAAAKLTVSDDDKAQVKSVLDDALKTLDGYKADANAVKDAETAKDFQQKLTTLRTDTIKQLGGILGQDDVRQLMQGMRTTGNTGLRGRGKQTTQPA